MARGPHPLAPRVQPQIAASFAVTQPATTQTVMQRVMLAASRWLTALATRPQQSAPMYADVMQAREADRDRWLGLTPPRFGA